MCKKKNECKIVAWTLLFERFRRRWEDAAIELGSNETGCYGVHWIHQDRNGPVVASCDEGFIDQLSDDQFLKKYFVPWSKIIRKQ
jgi:hypothetical protein